jgi:hypothetical protein
MNTDEADYAPDYLGAYKKMVPVKFFSFPVFIKSIKKSPE